METPEKVEKVDENTITLSKEEHKKLVEEKASLSQDKSNLVNEIKEIREKKSLSEEQVKELTSKVEELKSMAGDNSNIDVKELAEKTVKEFYKKQQTEARESAKQDAMSKFLSDNPEFSPENDELGLKKSAFEKKLGKFNLSNLSKEEDFISVYNDALSLMGSKKVVEDNSNPMDIQPSSNANPAEAKIDSLNAKELKVIDQFMGGDKEAFLKKKAKHPDFIDSLMTSVK